MSYGGESTSEAQEREQREREAAAFLSSLGPQFQKARSVSPGPGASPGKITQRTGGAVNGQKVAVNGGPQRAAGGTGGSISSSVNVSMQESEDKRQQALKRLKATHCSVNQEKVLATQACMQ